jgi:hypothetical protein
MNGPRWKQAVALPAPPRHCADVISLLDTLSPNDGGARVRRTLYRRLLSWHGVRPRPLAVPAQILLRVSLSHHLLDARLIYDASRERCRQLVKRDDIQPRYDIS